jgi:hypothetical protein
MGHGQATFFAWINFAKKQPEFVFQSVGYQGLAMDAAAHVRAQLMAHSKNKFEPFGGGFSLIERGSF